MLVQPLLSPLLSFMQTLLRFAIVGRAAKAGVALTRPPL
jgi:hypothetical protein